MISKYYFFCNILLITIQLTTVRAADDDKTPCDEPRDIACPDIICKMMKSRSTNLCEQIQCNGLSPENCRDGSVYEKGLTMCGCCGGCAKYIDVGGPCQSSPDDPSVDPNCNDPFCPIQMNRCKPGLVCKYLGPSSRVCAVDTTPRDPDDSCEYKRNLGMNGQLHYTPTCDDDGSYAPKQCKGGDNEEGVCFCAASDGTRIFGREWRAKSQNQTCGCSRHTYDLRQKGYTATLHCSPDGNYEPLQCDFDSKTCYCVDEITGRLTGAVFPEHLWKLLPCYSYNLTNWDPTGQYLRVCESEWAAGQRLAKQGIMHGNLILSVKDYDCDFDGSFGPVRRVQSLEYCSPKVGGLSAYFQMIEQFDIDCRCYRDSILYTEEGRNFMKTCSNTTGNYAETSLYIDSADLYSCVDRDGFFFGDLVPMRFECCLLGDCSKSPEAVRRECYNAATGTGQYHSCDFWQT